MSHLSTPEKKPGDAADPTDGGYTLVETVVAALILVTALLPVVSAVLYVSADPLPRWTAEATQQAQAEAERTLTLDPALWTTETLEDGPWRIHRQAERSGILARAAVSVWREGQGRGGSATEPLVSLAVARLITPPAPEP